MRTEIEWLDEAVAEKDIVVARTHYRVKDHMITATNGKIIAGHPCDMDGEFLVPGNEMKQIFKRLPDNPVMTVKEDHVLLRSGRFSGKLQILANAEWIFPELEAIDWKPAPPDLLPALRDLRPLTSNNASQAWSNGIAVHDGWCFATNSFILGGAKFQQGKGIKIILPPEIVDFIIARESGLQSWSVTNHFVAFRWNNSAWVRSNLINEQFHEGAGRMIQQVANGGTDITDEFRQSLKRICELATPKTAVRIFSDHAEGTTERSVLTEAVTSPVPANQPCSIWTVEQLALMLDAATSWDPTCWPAPTPFHGERIRGLIMGRRA